MTEKPLHVRVAEALGEKPVEAEWGYAGPPADGFWSHERSRLFRTAKEAEEAYRARKMEHALPGEWTLSFWKEGWGPLYITEYDTDWSATGPLIEKYGISVSIRNEGWLAEWFNGERSASVWATGDAPLIAVCNLILALKEAGKL